MPDSLGARLREARTSRGLSLRSVAQSIGVSASLVSQVEVGKTQPSVSTLFAMASHLGVSFDELLGMPAPGGAAHAAPAAPVAPAVPGSGGHSEAPLRQESTGQRDTTVRYDNAVQRSEDNPVIEMEDGVRWERLAADAGGAVDAVLVSYEPGASSSIEGKFMRHSGFEYADLIEGELTLHLESESHVLRAGDSLQFDSARPHLYENRGSTRVRGVWFLLGRRPQAAAVPSEHQWQSSDVGAARLPAEA